MPARDFLRIALGRTNAMKRRETWGKRRRSRLEMAKLLDCGFHRVRRRPWMFLEWISGGNRT